MVHHSIRTAVQPDVTGIVLLTILSTFGGRIVISEIQDDCPDLLNHDYVKVLVLYSMIYLALRGKEGNHVLSSAYWCAAVIGAWKFFKAHVAKQHCIEKKTLTQGTGKPKEQIEQQEKTRYVYL